VHKFVIFHAPKEIILDIAFVNEEKKTQGNLGWHAIL